MKRLDRTKPVCRITPPWDGEGEFDRPAHFEQDGAYFDARDREIIPGQPLKETKAAAGGKNKGKAAAKKGGRAAAKQEEPDEPDDDDDERDDDDEHDDDDDEGNESNDGNLTAAQVLALYDNKQMAWGAFRKEAKRILGGACPANKVDIAEALARAAAKGKSHKAAPPRGTKKEDPTAGIDLAAWGTGQKDYLFDEVRKAIRTRFNAVVTGRRAAVEVLLDNGIITGNDARKDLERL